MIRTLSRRALDQAGFKVFEAENGLKALSLFDETLPDLVMLDVLMPEMDGFEACAAIRQRPAGKLTPILMATGLDDIESSTAHMKRAPRTSCQSRSTGRSSGTGFATCCVRAGR